MPYPVNLKSRLAEVWPRAVRERPPNPAGAVGELIALFELFLDVEQIQNVVVENAASFLFDLSSLGFSGMGYNVLVVSPPPRNSAKPAGRHSF